MGGAFDIIRSDLFDEFWHIDAGRAAFGAGGIIAEQAAIGVDEGGIPRPEGGMDLAEIFRVFGIGEPVIGYRHVVFL
jgi:hypothetical protein